MTATLANLDRFNALAADWDDSLLRADIAHGVATAIAAQIPLRADMRALEYGCGTGLVSVLLAGRLGHIVAADVAPAMLGVLERKRRAAGLDQIETRRLDLTCEPLPAERFDLIFTSMTLHHIDDVTQMLGLFRDLLQPGGWVALADLDREDGSFHGPDVPGIMHQGFDRAKLVATLTGLDLQAVTATTAYTVEKCDPAGTPRRYPIFLITARRNPRDGG